MASRYDVVWTIPRTRRYCSTSSIRTFVQRVLLAHLDDLINTIVRCMASSYTFVCHCLHYGATTTSGTLWWLEADLGHLGDPASAVAAVHGLYQHLRAQWDKYSSSQPQILVFAAGSCCP